MRPDPGPRPADDVQPDAVKQVSAWLQMLLRTLKTSRLYGGQSPAALQFTGQLAAALEELLDRLGTVTLRFTAHTIQYRDAVVHQSQTRDDQLSMVFFRDGIQALSFSPGMPASELETFVSIVTPLFGRERGQEEDLVTLLWDAELPHLHMMYVSAETDLDLDGEPGERSRAESLGPPMAWPGTTAQTTSADETGTLDPRSTSNDPGARAGSAMQPSAPTRSEDWTALDPADQLDAEFKSIEAAGPHELARFLEERAAERQQSPREGLLHLIEGALTSGLAPGDQEPLSTPLRRILEESLAAGEWETATRAIRGLEHAGVRPDPQEPWASFVRPGSVLTRGVIARLDSLAPGSLDAFLELARAAGEPALLWLIRILGESEQQRVRKALVTVIAEASQRDLSAIGRSIDDARWYVVRNLAIALRTIGGPEVVPLLGQIAEHPERRVRVEVIAALAEVPPAAARPILLRMLETDEVRELSGTLRLLAHRPDPEVAEWLLARLRQPDFEQRSPEEHRAVLSALAITAANAALDPLSDLLFPEHKPAEDRAPFLRSVAQGVARIGTPEARLLLEHARASRWPLIRDAATLALSTMRPR